MKASALSDLPKAFIRKRGAGGFAAIADAREWMVVGPGCRNTDWSGGAIGCGAPVVPANRQPNRPKAPMNPGNPDAGQSRVGSCRTDART
jgi:hypothetical protein